MPDINCKKLRSQVIHSRKERQRSLLFAQYQTAEAAIPPLSKGCEIFGLTRGQFSLIDLMCVLLDQTGPADVDLATWTAADKDIDTMGRLLENELIQSLRLIVDPSFKTRKPDFCEMLLQRFDQEQCIRTSNTHAKFATIRNRQWNLVIRTSMNLTGNPRLENFEISDDPEFADFLQVIVDEVFKAPATENFRRTGPVSVEAKVSHDPANLDSIHSLF